MIVGQGEMEKTKHGALRESNEGRGRFDLLPYEAIEALAKWYEEGAKKYDERNWENGISVKDCINRMIRHSLKAGNGWTDENHLAAVMWNAAAAITMMQRRPDCNDHRWHVHKKDPSETITGVKSGKLHFDEELWCIDPSKIGPGQIKLPIECTPELMEALKNHNPAPTFSTKILEPEPLDQNMNPRRHMTVKDPSDLRR